jgi:fructose/tagatose bisphosphate aldolase
VSKINIATDLEAALYNEIGIKERLTESDFNLLDKFEINRGSQAVQKVVETKISDFLVSKGRAEDYH